MSESQVQDPVVQIAKGVWWWVLLRGVFAVIFGVLALVSPVAALTAIAIVFGVYVLLDGVIAIAHAVQVRKESSRWGWLLAEGIASVLAGIVVLALPAITAVLGGLIVLWTIVIWSLVLGVVRLGASAKQVGSHKTWAIVGGVLGILFAIVLAIMIFVTPGATLFALAWTIGIYAILIGVALVIAAFQVRSAIGRAQA